MAKPDRLALLAEATAAARKPAGTKCSVCRVEPDVLKKLAELVASGARWADMAIGLKAIGIDIPAARLSWHFRNPTGTHVQS